MNLSFIRKYKMSFIRAFFRRNTQREELPVCKSDGNCEITHEDRKQCSACRYSKCLRYGV